MTGCQNSGFAWTARFLRRSRLWAFGAVAIGLAAAGGPVLAQGWSWPWGDEPERRPVPREPIYRAPAEPAPPPGVQPPPSGASTWGGGRNTICLQLEQRLVQESQRGNQSRDLLPKLENDIRLAQRTYQTAQAELDRKDCYEYFLFSKSLRRTRQCVDLANQADTAKRQLADLDAQRQDILSSSGRSYQDDIIRELARNNCGGAYQQEARKRDGGSFSPFWQDEEGGGPGGGGSQYGNLPFATYRTLCVRLCDGYYFPISFSTLPNHFQRDDEVCQSKCAAPVELYYHQNPGGAVDQMVALKTQEPYTKLKSAFLYRKELIQGCSCKQAEYVPPESTPGQPGATPERQGSAAERRAEAAPTAQSTGASFPSKN